MQAKAICPSDPLVYNELGVVAYHMKECVPFLFTVCLSPKFPNAINEKATKLGDCNYPVN